MFFNDHRFAKGRPRKGQGKAKGKSGDDRASMTGNDNATAPNGEQGAALDMSDWAWEFLRRNPAYRSDWRASFPRRLPIVTLRDGTRLLRLRRRYPRAERWGLYAFTDPAGASPAAPVFWLPGIHGRLIRARGSRTKSSEAGSAAPLAAFAANRFAAIGIDGVPVVTVKGQGLHVALELHDLPVLTRPSSLVFELDRLDDLSRHTECLKILQRLTKPKAAGASGSIFGNDERLRHALIALDASLAGKTYRQIAISLFGEQRVAEDWRGVSRFLKDRTRRLVAKGHELMNGGYRDLLA
jgi:hypothetical protein